MTGTTGSIRRRVTSAAVLTAVLCGMLTACGSGGSGRSTAVGSPVGTSVSPSPSPSPGQARPGATTVLSQAQAKDALPDPLAMDNLQAVDEYLTTADGHLDCPSVQDCKGKWFGMAKYALSQGTYYINFELVTYTTTQDAEAGLLHEVGDRPRVSKPTIGDESVGYLKDGGGLQGEYITMRVGTVVATTFVEGGASEPMLTQGAQVFAQRLAQVEAGHQATATLPQS